MSREVLETWNIEQPFFWGVLAQNWGGQKGAPSSEYQKLLVFRGTKKLVKASVSEGGTKLRTRVVTRASHAQSMKNHWFLRGPS